MDLHLVILTGHFDGIGLAVCGKTQLPAANWGIIKHKHDRLVGTGVNRVPGT